MPTGASELDFVTTGELVDELAQRFDSLVVVGFSVTGNGTGKVSQYARGDSLRCLGLAGYMQRYLGRLLESDPAPLPGDDLCGDDDGDDEDAI